MSEEKGAGRPRQVTMAVVMGVISSVVLVLGLFDTLRRLRTPDMREVVDEFLAEAPGSSLGLDTAQVVELMRALAFASGALAAMALVFAIFVLQRHRAARVGFTVVAVLLLLTVPVTGLMPFFLAASAFLLWSQPARDWYVGRAPAAAGAGTGRSVPLLSHDSPRGSDTRGDLHEEPRTGGSTRADVWSTPEPDQQQEQPVAAPSASPQQHDQQWGQHGQQGQQGQQWDPLQPYYGQYGYGQGPYAPAGYPGASGRDPEKRPMTVTLAAVLTWIGAGTTALLMLAFLAVLAAGGDAFVTEFERAARESEVTLDPDQVMAIGWGIAGTFLAWSLISMVLAVLAFRRSNAARIALAVSAVMTALVSLVAIMSVVSLVTLLLAGAAAIMLFTGGANQWYSRRSSDDHRSGPPSGYPYAGHPPPQDAYSGQQSPSGQSQSGQPPQQQEPPRRNQPW